MTTRKEFLLAIGAVFLLIVFGTRTARGEDAAPDPKRQGPSTEEVARDEAGNNGEAQASFFASTTVTATGTEVDAFSISTPVAVISAEEIERRLPENAVDLLRTEPGVDVSGVGPNQARPVIRGQRGLRVLFLENGLRMNNARRQTDFGEIPGLVSVDNIETVEVVRGAASVLYGTDAIGGVLNLITKSPSLAEGIRGSASLGFGSASDQTRVSAAVEANRERLSFRLGGSYRDASDYDAPAGRFGGIDLAEDARVIDTGVQDESLSGELGYQAADNHQLSLRYGRYRADESGFGFVEPELLGGTEDFRIRILYPFQDFDRLTLGYVGTADWADAVEVRLYHQSNERQLQNDIDINIGPIGPFFPDSFVLADTLNFTDLDTLGLRAEMTRAFGQRHLLTWGLEAFEDESFNTDASETTTVLRFPFPPFEARSVSTDTVANAPNATNTSYGLFVQDEILAGERLKLTIGARYQNVETRAEATPGWDVSNLDFDDGSLVGALNLIYELNANLKLVGSIGTAFRAPNIIERLFNGPTPEGAGFQILNPSLTSEESENFDVGLKYRRANAIFEAIVFRNDIDEGVIQYFLSPAEIAALPVATQQAIAVSGARFVVQQRNIDRLRYEGVEVIVGYRMDNGVVFGGNYTYLDGERLDSTNPPSGDSAGDKINAYVRYEKPRGRYWVEYRLRHNGEEKANLDPNEPLPPVGERLPSFTVHSLSGGITLLDRGRTEHKLGIVIENLTDELYAEFSNATFFRPQSGFNVVANYRVGF